MGFKAISTSRSAATTAVSKQATVINNGTNFAVTGATITANSSISINTNTPGQTPNTQAAGLSISSINYLNANGTISTANAVSTSGGNIKINGAGFTSPMTVVVGGTTVANANVTVANTTSIIASLGSASPGNVSVYTFNSAGTGAQLANGVFYSGVPVWTTSSVSFQNGAAANVQLVASSDSTLTYTLQAGSSLPTGINLISTGYLSGTATGYSTNTSSTAVIIATDNENQATQQTITWTVTVTDPQFNYTTLLLNGESTNTPFIKDASANNSLLTIAGDTKANRFSPYYGDGYYSNYFDGTGDWLTYAGNPIDAISTGTIECWVNPANVTQQYIFAKQHDGTGTYCALTIGYYVNSSGSAASGTAGKVYFHSKNGVVQAVSTGTISANIWTHIAVVFSTSSCLIFINGVLDSTTSGDYSLPTDTNPTYTGLGIGPTTSNLYTGYISNFRITNTAVYSTTFTVPTTPLTAITGTQLLVASANRLIDIGPKASVVTKNGDVTVSSAIPFAPNSSYATYGCGYFDGSGDYLTWSSFAPAGNFTFECWFYAKSYPQSQCMLFALPWGGSNFQVMCNSDNTVMWQAYTQNSVAANCPITLNQWYHIAVVKNGSSAYIYINGVLKDTSSLTNSISGTALIGARNDGYNFSGYISDMRVVVGSAVYTTNFTPPTAPLTAVANTQLLTLQYNGSTNNNGFIDSSTNNFSITRNGSSTQGTFSPFSATGWSTYLSSSSYLQYPNLTAYSPRTGNFTLECWVFNTTAAGSNMWYVSHLSGGVSLYRDTTGKLAFAKDAIAVIATSTNTIPTNAWVHLAVARSGTSLKLFINGAQEASVTDSTDLVSTGNFDIGITSGGTGPMTGYISNIRLVTGSALYTSAFTPSTSPLTAVSGTQFLGCQSNRFLDNSTNNAAVTLGSAPLIQAYSPFSPANSYAPATNGGSMYCVDTSAFTSVSMGGAQAFGTGDFTVECWVYNTATSHNICMAATSTTTWELLTYGSQLYWHENSGNLGGGGYGTILLNAWSHFAVSRASGTLKMFINGVQVYSAANTYNYSNNSTVRYIGPDAGGTAGQYISDFRVINGTALYTSAFTPPSAPLTAVANTALLMSFTNGGVVDAHSSNDMETVGDAQLNTSITKFGTASIAFDGTGDYLKFTPGPNQNFAMGSGDWTIEMWMYPTSAGTTQLFFDVYDGNSSGRLTLQLNTSRTIGLYGASGAARTVSTGTVTLNTWQHIAFCKASGSTRIFINGTQVNTTYSDSVTYTCTTGPIYLAANGTNAGNNFFGYIDDLRITKGFARYTANFTAPSSAFLGQ